MKCGGFAACMAVLGLWAASAESGGVIRVPEEEATVQAAIDRCASGDVISIASDVYQENLRIIDKEVSLEGREGEGKPIFRERVEVHEPIFSIVGGTVRFQRISIPVEYFVPGIVVEDGDLELVDCDVSGGKTVRTGIFIYTDFQPALHLRNCLRRVCKLTNCQVSAGQIGDYPDGETAAFLVESCTRLTIQCVDSRIVGGDGYSDCSARGWGAMSGGSGVSILNCGKVLCDFTGCRIVGGIGTQVIRQRYPSYYSGPCVGGSGIVIHQSNVILRQGIYRGGAGGVGGEMSYSVNGSMRTDHRNGATGGNGLTVKERSNVTLFGVALEGGLGGEPDGETGAALQKDESSVVHAFHSSCVENWALYGD